MDDFLIKETFSQLQASDRAKQEVLSMMEQKKTRRSYGAARVLAVAAAAVMALAVTAGAVNVATDGELFDTLTVLWSNGHKIVMADENGDQVTAYGLNADVEEVDGRLLLKVEGETIDITDELASRGRYLYEGACGGLPFQVEVTGTVDDWTLTTSVDGEGTVSYAVTSDGENAQPDVIHSVNEGVDGVFVISSSGEGTEEVRQSGSR